MSEMQRAIKLAYEYADRESAKSAYNFLHHVVINALPSPKKFGHLIEPWQLDDYNKMVPAIHSLTGHNDTYSGPTSFWRGRPRGHDKTSGIARLATFPVAYGRRPIRGAVAAADAEQAALLREAVESLVLYNPWLKERVKVQQNRISGAGGTIKILTSESFSSFGLLLDLIIIDELTHWKKRDLFNVLISGKEKRPGAVTIVITNAGRLGSWHDEIRQAARRDKTWDVYEQPERTHLASWMSQEAVTRLRNFLPRADAKRVLDNIWIDPAEDSGFLLRSESEACENLGRELGLQYRVKGVPGMQYYASIDYGPKKDRTTLTVGHYDTPLQSVIVDKQDVWQGSPESPIQIARVEEWMEQTYADFNQPFFVCDPYQLEGTVQKFELRGWQIERFEARGGKKNYEMAENLRSLIVNKHIAWYPETGLLIVEGQHESLTDELACLIIKPMPYGYRFDHEETKHDDRSVGIGMMALKAVRDQSPLWVAPPVLSQPESPILFDYRIKPKKTAVHRRGLFGIES